MTSRFVSNFNTPLVTVPGPETPNGSQKAAARSRQLSVELRGCLILPGSSRELRGPQGELKGPARRFSHDDPRLRVNLGRRREPARAGHEPAGQSLPAWDSFHP